MQLNIFFFAVIFTVTMPKIVIPLTDTKIKTIKADSTKVQKLADDYGLFFDYL